MSGCLKQSTEQTANAQGHVRLVYFQPSDLRLLLPLQLVFTAHQQRATSSHQTPSEPRRRWQSLLLSFLVRKFVFVPLPYSLRLPVTTWLQWHFPPFSSLHVRSLQLPLLYESRFYFTGSGKMRTRP